MTDSAAPAAASDAPLTLVIGNRSSSSWSLRGWLVLAQSGLDFREEMIRLREPGFRERLAAASPGATVPALRHGDLALSESLAIAEYVAELAPDAGLWPADRGERAEARMLATRMVAGFRALRAECPMNASQRFAPRALSEGVQADIDALVALWRPPLARRRDADDGPFLFGRFGIVDAFFAPVALRAYSYRIPLPEDARAYCAALIAQPLVQRWLHDAAAEPPRDPALVGEFAEGDHTPGDFPILDDPTLAAA